MRKTDYIRKPAWLKVEKGRGQCGKVNRILNSNGLNSVCSEAGCPNQGECFKNGTATFLLMGKTCTRNCRFCQITQSRPEQLDLEEPKKVAEAVQSLGLSHVVITSVTRDDLDDGGASHFAATIRAVREVSPEVTIEVLIPDFKGDLKALQTVMEACPDILNHNVETIPELYSEVRPMAIFERSLEVLVQARRIAVQLGQATYTKSGFMVGLGETKEQVYQLLMRLHQAGCDMVTIGQYLQPSGEHYPVKEYIHPDVFKEYQEEAYVLGISCVASGPLVRSSYHAKDDFMRLKEQKLCLQTEV